MSGKADPPPSGVIAGAVAETIFGHRRHHEPAGADLDIAEGLQAKPRVADICPAIDEHLLRSRGRPEFLALLHERAHR